jgi:hypothetical protein
LFFSFLFLFPFLFFYFSDTRALLQSIKPKNKYAATTDSENENEEISGNNDGKSQVSVPIHDEQIVKTVCQLYGKK